MNLAWTKEFCQLMIAKKVDISWQANTRIDLVNEVELRLMRDAGLVQIDFGIESGSMRTLAKLKKNITVEQIKEKVKLTRKYAKVFGFFMIGIPGEQEEDVQETFKLAKELELDRSTWSIYSPLPGSTLYDELIEEDKIEPDTLDFERIHFTKAYKGISNISPARLQALYKEINDYFYIELPKE